MKINKILHHSKTAPQKMPRNRSSVIVTKFKIKEIEFRIRFFGNGGRISNMNHKLKVEVFTLSRTKVYEKITFLMNRFYIVNKHQII